MRKIFNLLAFCFIAASASAQTPTWSDNVACIIYTHCTKCHNPAGIAPSSLLTYADAVARATDIKTQTRSGAMPPWKSNRNYSTFAHERYLTPQEIDILSRWADAGAPEGDISHAPAAPVYSTSEEISSPDLVTRMGTYTVPTSITSDLYRCFVMHPGLSGTNYITGIEGIPGNSAIVHHILIYQDTTGIPDALDAADPENGYTNFGGIGSSKAILIGAWVPGSGAYFLPSGMGIRLLPNAKIVMQIHYPASGAGGTDSSKINFKFSTSPGLRNVFIEPPLNYVTSMTDGPINIPANTTRTYHERYHIPINVTVLSVAPHMHLIGQSIKAYCVTAANDTIPLIDIPKWDFHWQGFYDFPKPVKIPANSYVYAVATYDNTTANPENPSSPPRAVHAGESTTDEMMLVYFSYLYYQAGDENIIVDTTSGTPPYLGCNFATAIPSPSQTQIRVYPNPTSQYLQIALNTDLQGQINLINSLGEVVKSVKLDGMETILDIQSLPSGMYEVQLVSEAGVKSNAKFIKQ
jgi:hypothetical protein